MIEHTRIGRLKIMDRKPSGGQIKVTRCEKCNTVVVSNRPGDAYKCKCGWSMNRTA